jgi:hypothetical protein
MDYSGGFQLRANQSTGSVAPSYYTALSITNSGYVGIGTNQANNPTVGGNRCYGLEVYGSSDGVVPLLRLVNTNTVDNATKATSIQFAASYNASGSIPAGQKLMAEIVTRSLDNRTGWLEFWSKRTESANDGADLQRGVTIHSEGLSVGHRDYNLSPRIMLQNTLGSLFITTLNADGQIGSVNMRAGDGFIGNGTDQMNRNLLINAGGFGSGILIQRPDLSSNFNNKQSRVGIGSFTPTAILDVYRKDQFILSDDEKQNVACEAYLLSVKGGLVYVAKTNAFVDAPSIYLEGTPLFYGNSTTTTARMVIEGGRCGGGSVYNGGINFYTGLLGTGDPLVRISGGSESLSNTTTYFGLNSNYLTTSAQTITQYAIYARNNVITTHSFIVFSDERIKKNIVPVEPEKALDVVNRLQVCEYEMRDSIKDPGRKIGVIAQQVREVLPEAVKVSGDEYVADLLAFVKLVYNDQNECMIQLFDAVSLEEGDQIRLINDRQESKDVMVVRRLNEKVFSINELLDTERSWMVYGTLQKGILAVDKPMLGMVALSAIQELSSKVKSLEQKLEEQQSQIQAMWDVVMRK